jgi:hypothetical protein
VEPCFVCKEIVYNKKPCVGEGGWCGVGGRNIVNYRNVFHKFPILNILETRKCILQMLFTFVPEYDIRNIVEKNDRLILNRTHQVLGYADDKLLNTVKRNTEVLIVIRNAVGLK